jgi:DNA-binding transcriptional regulator WhiA
MIIPKFCFLNFKFKYFQFFQKSKYFTFSSSNAQIKLFTYHESINCYINLLISQFINFNVQLFLESKLLNLIPISNISITKELTSLINSFIQINILLNEENIEITSDNNYIYAIRYGFSFELGKIK